MLTPDVSGDVDALGDVDTVDCVAGANTGRSDGRGRHEAHRLLENCVEVRQLGDCVARDVLVPFKTVADFVLQPCEAVDVGWPGEVPDCGGEGGCAGFGTGCKETTHQDSRQPVSHVLLSEAQRGAYMNPWWESCVSLSLPIAGARKSSTPCSLPILILDLVFSSVSAACFPMASMASAAP